jgi:very-short-patch-repair endonuclease
LHKRTTPKIFQRAKELRRDMTPVERKFHAHLRAHRLGGVYFQPQHAIANYIVDFPQRGSVQCAPREKLIIELDGRQHLDQKEYDNERTKYFERAGTES